MPAEYANHRVRVLCNDCLERSEVRLHVIGHRVLEGRFVLTFLVFIMSLIQYFCCGRTLRSSRSFWRGFAF
jgi:hypothetical protein